MHGTSSRISCLSTCSKGLGDSGIQRGMFNLAAKTVVPSPNTFWVPQRFSYRSRPTTLSLATVVVTKTSFIKEVCQIGLLAAIGDVPGCRCQRLLPGGRPDTKSPGGE